MIATNCASCCSTLRRQRRGLRRSPHRPAGDPRRNPTRSCGQHRRPAPPPGSRQDHCPQVLRRAPFWKLVFIGHHVWVRCCHGTRDADKFPEYVFALQPTSPCAASSRLLHRLPQPVERSALPRIPVRERRAGLSQQHRRRGAPRTLSAPEGNAADVMPQSQSFCRRETIASVNTRSQTGPRKSPQRQSCSAPWRHWRPRPS